MVVSVADFYAIARMTLIRKLVMRGTWSCSFYETNGTSWWILSTSHSRNGVAAVAIANGTEILTSAAVSGAPDEIDEKVATTFVNVVELKVLHTLRNMYVECIHES